MRHQNFLFRRLWIRVGRHIPRRREKKKMMMKTEITRLLRGTLEKSLARSALVGSNTSQITVWNVQIQAQAVGPASATLQG